jgi:hypothetical protein
MEQNLARPDDKGIARGRALPVNDFCYRYLKVGMIAEKPPETP